MKKNRITRLNLTEISAVGRPAQEGALHFITKSNESEAEKLFHKLMNNLKETSPVTTPINERIAKIATDEKLTPAQATVRFYERNPGEYLKKSDEPYAADAHMQQTSGETLAATQAMEKLLTDRMERYDETREEAFSKVSRTPKFQELYDRQDVAKRADHAKRYQYS